MSEKLNESTERHEQPETLQDPEHLLPTPEQAEPLRAGEKDPTETAERLEEARDDVEEAEEQAEQANPLESLQDNDDKPVPAAPGYVSDELKKADVDRQMAAIRHGLSAPARGLSKVVHQPVVRAVSEPAAKTLGRPSGLFGGGLVAFLGTGAYLYLAETSGLQYSYFVFLALFAGGFVLGLILELVLRAATSARR